MPSRLVKRGRKPQKDLKKLKQWIIKKIEEKGKVSWSELWKEGKQLFKSQKYLSQCLRELTKERVIEKKVVSHKKRFYTKGEYLDTVRKLLQTDREEELLHLIVLKQLQRMKSEIPKRYEREAFILSLILKVFSNILSFMYRVGKTPTTFMTEWAYHVLENRIRRSMDIIVTCGRTCEEETDKAIRMTCYILQQPIKNIADLIPYVHFSPLPDEDLDICKAEKEFKELMKRLQNS